MASGPDAAPIDAAARGDAPAVARLLATGASPKARDPRGRTALLAATQGNHPEAARRLLEAGAPTRTRRTRSATARSRSPVRAAHVESLRMTIAAGADLKSTNRFGGTALIPACHCGHVEAVRELLKTPIDVDHVDGRCSRR